MENALGSTTITGLAQSNYAMAKAAAGQGQLTGTKQNLDTASKEFEAMFIAQMMRPMFDTLSTDSTFGGGTGETMFRSVLVDEMGKSMADRGGIGVSQIVKNHFLKQQEAKDAAPGTQPADSGSH